MPQTTEAYDFRGRTVIDADGEKIGKIDELYYDEQGGQPEWALVNTGLFGTKKTFVPIRSASPAGEDLKVPVSKEQVKDAPRVDADQELSESEERQLFDHYGVPYTTEGSTTAAGSRTSPEREVGHVTAGSKSDEATIGSEELRLGVVERPGGHVRLRKYALTENVQKPAPGRRDEVRAEREPITGENTDDAMSGP